MRRRDDVRPQRRRALVSLPVTAWPTDGAVAAWASGCLTDQVAVCARRHSFASLCAISPTRVQYGRPIAGHMNFGPNAGGTSSEENLLVVAAHEMVLLSCVRWRALTCCALRQCKFHALGFASYRFDNFMRPNGEQYKPVKQVTLGSNGATKTAWLITSPRVVAAAREYFNCPVRVPLTSWRRRAQLKSLFRAADTRRSRIGRQLGEWRTRLALVRL